MVSFIIFAGGFAAGMFVASLAMMLIHDWECSKEDREEYSPVTIDELFDDLGEEDES